MHRIGFFLFCVFSTAFQARTQTLSVYPGDVTNNGRVNNIDFLYLGLGYNYVGPPRDSTVGNGLDFLPQPADSWAFTLPNGVNAAYADCNGDGLVNYFYDAFPIYVNYGKQRQDSTVKADPYLPGTQGVDPTLSLSTGFVPPQMSSGFKFSVPIILGDADVPAEDLYGIAFSLYVDPLYIDASQTVLDFTETSWANPDDDRVYMYKKINNERIDVAWVRTDHNQRSGYGKIGRADFVIIVDVVGLQQNFNIRVDSVHMIDKFGNYTVVAGDTIHIAGTDSAASAGQTPAADYIDIAPQPAKDRFRVTAPENILELSLVNALGQPVWTGRFDGQRTVEAILPAGLPFGFFALKIQTQSGLIVKPVLCGVSAP